MGRFLAAGCALSVGALAYARLEAEWFVLRRYTVPLLPPGSRPIRVLHVSDLHLTAGQARKIRWVRNLAGLHPDFIVNTGDNMANEQAFSALREALEPLMDVPGAFVFGSNDYFSARWKNPVRYMTAHREDELLTQNLPTAELGQAFVDAGWLDLNNNRAELQLCGQDVQLVGVNDPHIGLDDMPARRKKRGAHATDSIRLGVVHAPYQQVLHEMRGDGAAMVFAGHTHGGQLNIPGWGPLVSNCDLPPRLGKGLHRWSNPQDIDARAGAPDADADTPVEGTNPTAMWLHVSAGLGTSPYTPFRFACRPEASLITLEPSA